LESRKFGIQIKIKRKRITPNNSAENTWKLPVLSQKSDVENSRNTEISWAIQNKKCSWFCPK